MKNTTIITMAALLLGSSGLHAEETTAYTKPSGFVTHTLKAGQFNLIGLTLHEAITVSGKFSAVAGTTLSDSNVAFDTVLTSGKTYVLEITSGALNGTIQEVTAWSGNDITTPDDLTVGGAVVAVDDTYQLRPAMTLADVFGADNTAGLLGGASSTLADNIYLRKPGGFDTYYYSTGGFFGVGWRKVGGGATDYADQPVMLTDSFYIFRKGDADLDFVLTGTVKTVKTSTAITETFSFVSGLYPVGSTLSSSGMQSSLTGGDSSTLADKVMFRKVDGGFDNYYYSTGGFFGVGWRKVGAGNVDQGDVELPSAFIINRVGNSDFNLGINPPASYGDL